MVFTLKKEDKGKKGGKKKWIDTVSSEITLSSFTFMFIVHYWQNLENENNKFIKTAKIKYTVFRLLDLPLYK